MKVLRFVQQKADEKLFDLFPHPKRTKRGLINGLGSIFKSISGNLDATDGERYDKMIEELQRNQNEIIASVKVQNSLSLELIEKFNKTVQQISHNENLLAEKIDYVYSIFKGHAYSENNMVLKETIMQLTSVYETIITILQDIENSVLFSRINILHPSIIHTADLFNELKGLENKIGKDHLPLPITLETIPLYEKLIRIHSYSHKNKITYILKIPITYSFRLNLYHLIPIPVLSDGQFRVIIPQTNYLLKNELYFAFLNNSCVEITPGTHICENANLQPIAREQHGDDPCEIQLFHATNVTKCSRTVITVTQPICERIEQTKQWIFVHPKEDVIKAECFDQKQIIKLIGTYLVNIPISCHIETNGNIIKNDLDPVVINQPLLFPDLNQDHPSLPETTFNLNLDLIKLDELSDIKTRISQNVPILLPTSTVTWTPSIWTIIIYSSLVAGSCYFLYRWFQTKRSSQAPAQKPHEYEAQPIQLPL
nr:unnamed protein product [Callosobruchus chinensis]CAH7753509.1 unnamed protein product [Callosobruchus chinensis]